MGYGFIARMNGEAAGRFLSGHAITAGYLTAIGPIEFSAMYGDQSGKFQAYVNIGLAF
jgi:outer membrane translocation and assembly module TamA